MCSEETKDLETKLSSEQKCVAFLLAKNLRDLSETALAIIGGINKKDRRNLPSEETLRLCMAAMENSFPKNLFQNGQFNYKKRVIESYTGITLAFDIYEGIKNNINRNIVDAIERRDEKYFLDHYNTIFAVILENPFVGTYVDKFRYLLNHQSISSEDREIVWNFFDEMANLIVQEKEFINKHLKET